MLWCCQVNDMRVSPPCAGTSNWYSATLTAGSDTLRPFGVVMAGADVVDPFKD